MNECEEHAARRLKKFVKIPSRRAMIVEGRPGGVRGECQMMSENNLLENLVKNKPQILVDR